MEKDNKRQFINKNKRCRKSFSKSPIFFWQGKLVLIGLLFSVFLVGLVLFYDTNRSFTDVNYVAYNSNSQEEYYERLESVYNEYSAEDRDFSYRLSKLGDTILVPELQLIHKAVPNGRIPSRKKTFMMAVHQYYLVKKHFNNSTASIVMYWWNMLIRYGISLFTSLQGYIKNDIYVIQAAKDVRESFYYVFQHRRELERLDMDFFHKFLLQ